MESVLALRLALTINCNHFQKPVNRTKCSSGSHLKYSNIHLCHSLSYSKEKISLEKYFHFNNVDHVIPIVHKTVSYRIIDLVSC